MKTVLKVPHRIARGFVIRLRNGNQRYYDNGGCFVMSESARLDADERNNRRATIQGRPR